MENRTTLAFEYARKLQEKIGVTRSELIEWFDAEENHYRMDVYLDVASFIGKINGGWLTPIQLARGQLVVEEIAKSLVRSDYGVFANITERALISEAQNLLRTHATKKEEPRPKIWAALFMGACNFCNRHSHKPFAFLKPLPSPNIDTPPITICSECFTTALVALEINHAQTLAEVQTKEERECGATEVFEPSVPAIVGVDLAADQGSLR